MVCDWNKKKRRKQHFDCTLCQSELQYKDCDKVFRYFTRWSNYRIYTFACSRHNKLLQIGLWPKQEKNVETDFFDCALCQSELQYKDCDKVFRYMCLNTLSQSVHLSSLLTVRCVKVSFSIQIVTKRSDTFFSKKKTLKMRCIDTVFTSSCEIFRLYAYIWTLCHNLYTEAHFDTAYSQNISHDEEITVTSTFLPKKRFCLHFLSFLLTNWVFREYNDSVI